MKTRIHQWRTVPWRLRTVRRLCTWLKYDIWTSSWRGEAKQTLRSCLGYFNLCDSISIRARTRLAEISSNFFFVLLSNLTQTYSVIFWNPFSSTQRYVICVCRNVTLRFVSLSFSIVIEWHFEVNMLVKFFYLRTFCTCIYIHFILLLSYLSDGNIVL